jgi:hypothetical protein
VARHTDRWLEARTTVRLPAAKENPSRKNIKAITKMNWDIFKGFWLGVLSLLFVEITFIWSIDETKGKDDDHNHPTFKPA